MPVQSSIHWKPLRDSHYVIASLEPAEGGRRQLVIKQAILLQLQTLARTAPTEQLAGLLLGTQYDCPVTGKRYVTIESLARGAPIPDGSALEPTIRSLIGQVRGGGSMECVGWYCGTLVFEPRLRATHEAIHATFFPERWQTALVISDYGNAGAFFLHDPQAARWFQSPFYEEIEPTRKPPPTKPTCVSWANYLTMDAVALMAPRPLADVPSAPPPAPISAPRRTQIAAPPPPMPPRPITTHRPVVGPPLRRVGGVAVSGSKSSLQQLRDASSRVVGAVSRRGPAVRDSATDTGKSIAGHVSSMVRASVSLIARTRDASARFIEREAARRKAAAAKRAAVESARKAEAARQRAEAVRAQEARDRADLLARRRAEAARLQAAREKEAARLRALRDKEAAKVRAAREKEAAKLQAAREKQAAKVQAAREKEAAKLHATREKEAAAQAAREQEAAKAQAARDREAAKVQAAREKEAARLQAAREKEAAKVQAAREKADAEARQRAEAARVLADREQAELAARQKAEAARAAAPARPSVRRTAETQPPAAVAALPNQAPDLEDTTASDPPFRYLALAARDGFVLVTNSSGSDRLDFWLLDDSDSGMLLTVVTSDVSVREAILHYNVRTEDDALLQRTPAEYRDLEARTIYVRESVVDQLRARTRRLRATGGLVREWKVSPPIELPHASRSSTMGLGSGPVVADVALGTATRD